MKMFFKFSQYFVMFITVDFTLIKKDRMLLDDILVEWENENIQLNIHTFYILT